MLKKLSILWLLMLSTNLPYAESLTYEGFWTNDINPENTDRQIYLETAPVGPLYLCIRIKGEKDMLDILRGNNDAAPPLQPTRHKWFRYIGTRPFFEEAQKPINVVSFPTTDKSTHQPDEPTSVQFFKWFMCSGRQQVRTGWWQVEVVYTNNEPVLCGEKPCNYKILIK